MKNILLLVVVFCFLSCSDEGNSNTPYIIHQFSDSFDAIDVNWDTAETNGPSRYEIKTDPLNAENNALRFQLLPNDFIEGKKRNELKLKTDYDVTYDVNYSFKFLLPSEFFQDDKELDWIMIQQWHDQPTRGLSWATYNEQTNPPVHLYIRVLPGNQYYLVYAYGLHDKNRNQIVNLTYEYPLKPNQWYSFENTVSWSMNDTGFSIPKINGEFLVEKDDNDEGKLFGANMFNDVPNYYKMGLYGNYKRNDSISIYIDDFNYLLTLPK